MRKGSWLAAVVAIACAGTSSSPTGQQVAAPTFSPAGGTYGAAQSVAISSATSGAVIHCTVDASTPTAASPVCASPIAVATTTTLRAIATATGYADSAVATATYTIAQGTTLLEALQALSDRRQLLAHQSVGGNVLYGGGWDGSHGLDRLCRDNPQGGVQVIEEPASLAQVPLGGWAEAAVGVNGDPLGKLDAFDQMVRTRFGGGLDFAAMKFCYVDFTATSDVQAIWARYQVIMDGLEADFPGKIVYWTVPLQTDHSGNPHRDEFSRLIRGKYGATGRVFDLADLEAHDAQGNLVLVDGFPALAPEWSTDGGHLNDVFADRVARAYIELMYRIEVGAAP